MGGHGHCPLIPMNGRANPSGAALTQVIFQFSVTVLPPGGAGVAYGGNVWGVLVLVEVFEVVDGFVVELVVGLVVVELVVGFVVVELVVGFVVELVEGFEDVLDVEIEKEEGLEVVVGLDDVEDFDVEEDGGFTVEVVELDGGGGLPGGAIAKTLLLDVV